MNYNTKSPSNEFVVFLRNILESKILRDFTLLDEYSTFHSKTSPRRRRRHVLVFRLQSLFLESSKYDSQQEEITTGNANSVNSARSCYAHIHTFDDIKGLIVIVSCVGKQQLANVLDASTPTTALTGVAKLT